MELNNKKAQCSLQYNFFSDFSFFNDTFFFIICRGGILLDSPFPRIFCSENLELINTKFTHLKVTMSFNAEKKFKFSDKEHSRTDKLVTKENQEPAMTIKYMKIKNMDFFPY